MPQHEVWNFLHVSEVKSNVTMGVCFSDITCMRNDGCAWWDTATVCHLPHYRSSNGKWHFYVIFNSMTLSHEGTCIGIALWSRPFQVRPHEQASLRCKCFNQNSHKFLIKVRIGRTTSVLRNLRIPTLSLGLSTAVAGVCLEEKVCADRVTDWVSAGQQIDLSLWRGAL